MLRRKGNITKTCIVTPEYPPDQWGGLARTVKNVSRHIRDMGIEVHVAHFTVTDEPMILLDENRRNELIDGIMVHRMNIGKEEFYGRPLTMWDSPYTRTFKMMYQSLELLHDDQCFDCFHSFFLYPAGYITGLIARKTGKPSIVTIVGNDVKKYIFSPEKTAMCKSGLENADRVVVLSRDLLDTADALSSIKGKAQIIYNSVSIPTVPWTPQSVKNNTFHIGCAGIFKYAKGLPYLFKAIAELRKQHDVTLELTGTIRDSERKTCEDMIKGTGIQDILTFHPAVSHEKVTDWLLSLDAFVLPSVSEGCPNILMEAMACGLPCVATRVGAVENLMEDGISGFIVPWGSANTIADALERIITLSDGGLALGIAARERMTNFSPERERWEWEQVYRQFMGFNK
ncbi:MAG: glycosyltransferase [Proteobacteria bacterium]|nr:glycosyltransferase [Pseudomonadota bacterium]